MTARDLLELERTPQRVLRLRPVVYRGARYLAAIDALLQTPERL